MNYIKNLWQPSNNLSDPANSPFLNFTGEGTFYQVRKFGQENIFASARIRFQFASEEYLYYLKIENTQSRATRGIDKENVISEHTFKISDKLNLTTNYARKRTEDIMVFEWQDNNNITYGFEFRNKKRNLVAASNFKELLCKLIYQSKYRIHVTDKTPLGHYLCFCKPKEDNIAYKKSDPLTCKDECFLSMNVKKLEEEDCKVKKENMDIENEGAQKKITKHDQNSLLKIRDMNKSQRSSSTSTKKYNSNTFRFNIPEKGLIYRKIGDLYQLDESYKFVKMQECAIFCIRDLIKVGYQLELYNLKNKLLYMHEINDGASYLVDVEEGLFKWIDIQDETMRVLGFKLCYDSKNALEELKEILLANPNAKMDQSFVFTNKAEADLSSAEDFEVKASVLDSHEEFHAESENLLGGGLEEEREEPEEHKSAIKDTREEEEEVYYNDEGEEVLEYKKIYKYFEPENRGNYENQSISQSKLLDRVFVSRGPVVTVFKAHDSLEYICTLPNLTTLNNELLHPKKLLFYSNDKKMLVLSQALEKKIYSLDLERGSITDEWVIDGYNSILDINRLMKNGELCQNDLFMGINTKNIFQFNPHNQLAPLNIKSYSTNPRFCCFSTTAQGNFATGSLNGDIRLFKEIGQNAKNLITGCKESILGVDSTKDGSILVATTESSILIYCTQIDEINGYLNSIKKIKSEPIELFLPMKIVEKYALETIKFTKAKFDNVYKESERYILTSVGSLIVVWELSTVWNNINEPKVYPMKSTVLDCEFTNNRDNTILVVLEDEVDYIVI